MDKIVIRPPRTKAERAEIKRLRAEKLHRENTKNVIELPVKPKSGAFKINGQWIARTADGKEYAATSAEDAQGIVKRGKPFELAADKKAGKK
jgi:hypothetical protein